MHKKTKSEVPIVAGNSCKGLLIIEDHDDYGINKSNTSPVPLPTCVS